MLAVGVLAPLLVFGQSQSQSDAGADPGWEVPRLPSGQPDLGGYWTTQTFTSMERHEYLGDQAFYTRRSGASSRRNSQSTVPTRWPATSSPSPTPRNAGVSSIRPTATRATSTTTMPSG